MYRNRNAEEIFKLAVIALSSKFLDNLGVSVKKIAADAKVSEKQLHFWKRRLQEEGPKIFSCLKPGRRKVASIVTPAQEKNLLVYESINHLLVQVNKEGDKRQRFSAQLKERILAEMDRLKRNHNVSYQEFASLLGIDSGTLRHWQRRYQKEGVAGLQERSRAPKYQPAKLPSEITRKIGGYGVRRQRRHRRIKITEFSAAFRHKYRRLLAKYGKSNLSDKTIGRYLKAAGLCQEKKERYEGKRGAFHYYFPGAQFLMDTVVVKFLGLKAKVVGVMDAFSRRVFHQEGILKETAAKVLRCIRASLSEAERLGLKVLSTLSDHGKPYKAGNVRDTLRGVGIYRVFAHPYHPQGKAAIERYFRTLKEALSDRWEIFWCLVEGIFLRIKKVVSLFTLNLILTGFQTRYQRRQQPGIDNKSPRERLQKEVSPEYQGAVTELLTEQERNSQLKAEYINDICKEFQLPQRTEKYLTRYRKEDLKEAAETLRKKLTVAEMKPKHRFYYLAKILTNQEKKHQEERDRKVQRIIFREEQKVREEKRRQQLKEEQAKHDSHPEEFLEHVIEWYLLFYDKTFARNLYQTMITESIEEILLQHSSLTAGLKVERLCQKVREKNHPETPAVLKGELFFPEGEKLQAAKEAVVRVIQKGYERCKKELPTFQGLTRIWRGT